MCAEIDRERCHRSTRIGEALRRRGAPLVRIDRDGNIVSQAEVFRHAPGRQALLFGASRDRPPT